MAAFAEETQRLEFDISEGRVRKYAIIGNLDIEIRYEEIEDEEREVTVTRGRTMSIRSSSPSSRLLRWKG